MCVCVWGVGGLKPFFFSLRGRCCPWQNPQSGKLTRFLQNAAYSRLSGMLVQTVHRSVTPSPPPPIPAICCHYLFIHLGEERPRKKLYIGNYNTTRDTLKLSHISPAWRLVKLTILKYHLWYLCQISPQIMLLPLLTIYYSVFLNSCFPKHIKLKIIIILLINFDHWLC